MRWTSWTAALAALGAVAAGAVTFSCSTRQSQTAEPVAMTPEQKIARGRYLVTFGGCNDCHTPGTLYGAPDTSRLLSGSELGWQGPMGTTYARNLTPDVETGLGSWSEADIVKALRSGQRPNGTPILPPMPWPNTATLTDEDAAAVAAFLKSIPAVSHRVPDVVPAGKKAAGAVVPIPPPPPWDAPAPPVPPTAR